VIKTLSMHTPEKTLTDGIRSRSVIRSCENLDATCVGSSREAQPKLPIVITDEVFRPLPIRCGFPKRDVRSRHQWESV
jgi:hypothetical protein